MGYVIQISFTCFFSPLFQMWLLETENYMHGLHLIYTKQHGVESTVDER